MSSRRFVYRLTLERPALLREGPSPEEARIVEEHVAYLQTAAGEGRVDLFGRTDTDDEGTYGIVVFQARDEEEARAFMAGDPAVARGLMRADLRPFRLVFLRGNELAS